MQNKFKSIDQNPKEKISIVLDEIRALDPKPQRHAIILINIFHSVNINSKALFPDDCVIASAAKFGEETGLINKHMRTENIEAKILDAIEALSEKGALSLSSLDLYIKNRLAYLPEEDRKKKDEEYTVALFRLNTIFDRARDAAKIDTLLRDSKKSNIYDKVVELKDKKVVSSIALTSSLLSYYKDHFNDFKRKEKYVYAHPDIVMNAIAIAWSGREAYDVSRIADAKTLEKAGGLVLDFEETASSMAKMISGNDFGLENNKKAFEIFKEIVRQEALPK